jgi:small subunit ribosomal protein S20
MANHASAAKRNRQRISRTARNRVARGPVRSALKKARAALAAGDAEAAKGPVLAASKALAHAAAKGAIHANAAARTTSRINSQLARLASGS